MTSSTSKDWDAAVSQKKTKTKQKKLQSKFEVMYFMVTVTLKSGGRILKYE